MGECEHCTRETPALEDDDVAVVLFDEEVVSQETQNQRDREEEQDEERSGEQTEETIHLRSNWLSHDEEEGRSERSRGKATLCPPACCVRTSPASSSSSSPTSAEKPKRCPGLGLFYAFLSTLVFSIVSLLVKTIQDIHAIEISAIRCLFQMIFVVPLLIYHKTGFLGPRDKRIYLVLRGFLGSIATILFYYAIQQMPLADAIVIMFSNPVFTSLLAWVFLKEKCTIWDFVFTIFTIAGVILVARPSFIFGERLSSAEGVNHVKGAAAAFAGAIAAAFTFVILRKMGKSVHYYLSLWYYAVIGLIASVITVSVLGEWKVPNCGRDRWMLIVIAVLGIAGQTFLTKALQIEKAGPVSLLRTVDVVLAFIFQFIFFNLVPTWWSLGGALCVVVSTSGVAVRKWYTSSHKNKDGGNM
ncbi:solute carrier family 35 member G1 isoform X2 [Austrofundulus limnaeus]|uniref:Solute carrier family 35 member G1 n=1 Tax=Austrofundulus limnaeus TaxID=52670 RepID=A0A2I4B5N6_AUSLI|nr:PREDICTED: solute carrier family 35 member G1 isoform X2 [Austrofundulus limnaeus]